MSLSLSVVVVVHDMQRELPRTLTTLAPEYQRGVDADDYEVIVVDNGSEEPLDPGLVDAFSGSIRALRLDPAPPSPARAANLGIETARGDLVGLIIDGARMTSPGLLALARRALSVAPRVVVATTGYHLGASTHMAASEHHDQVVEDALLDGADWQADGYRLFEISVLAASSGRGWFGPMGESSALFMPATMWRELGGLDESFALPGGGLVNHDLYRRACSLPDAELITLLGEGTFHQFHGGAATSRRFRWEEMHAEYEGIRGERHRPPGNRPIYLGSVPATARRHLEESARLAGEREARQRASQASKRA